MASGEPTPPDISRSFEGLFGFELLESTAELGRAEIPVRDEVKQALGLVHGGVYAAAAEALASICTALVVIPEGKLPVGLSNNTSFLRPITAGTIHVVARRRHRGRTTWIWDVEASDDEGRLCAMTRATIAVRPRPGDSDS